MPREPSTDFERFVLDRSTALLRLEVMLPRFFADLSEGTVKAHTSRAVTRLRQALGENVVEDIHEH